MTVCLSFETLIVLNYRLPKNDADGVDVDVVISFELVELNSDFEEQPQLDGIRKKAVKIPRSGSLGSTDISLKF